MSTNTIEYDRKQPRFRFGNKKPRGAREWTESCVRPTRHQEELGWERPTEQQAISYCSLFFPIWQPFLENMSQNLSFRLASLADAEAVMEITNEAFVADTFFKKPKYHERFDLPTVIEMINAENSMFLLAESISETNNVKNIVGSLYLQWEVRQNGSLREVIGNFSAVSVPPCFGKQGIGKALVDEAESRIREIAINLSHDNHDPEIMTTASLQMGVINQRQDLFPWYEKQGFQITGEIRGDPEIERIVLEDLKDNIYLVLMSKSISLK